MRIGAGGMPSMRQLENELRLDSGGLVGGDSEIGR